MLGIKNRFHLKLVQFSKKQVFDKMHAFQFCLNYAVYLNLISFCTCSLVQLYLFLLFLIDLFVPILLRPVM